MHNRHPESCGNKTGSATGAQHRDFPAEPRPQDFEARWPTTWFLIVGAGRVLKSMGRGVSKCLGVL